MVQRRNKHTESINSKLKSIRYPPLRHLPSDSFNGSIPPSPPFPCSRLFQSFSSSNKSLLRSKAKYEYNTETININWEKQSKVEAF
mmetsp:Transcript_30484/g.55628  ORF Transcript_30484/g.55628 Transcript_30484/m.55628 type:complete len:86 (-) Transcript_30484:1194-1451(-)